MLEKFCWTNNRHFVIRSNSAAQDQTPHGTTKSNPVIFTLVHKCNRSFLWVREVSDLEQHYLLRYSWSITWNLCVEMTANYNDQYFILIGLTIISYCLNFSGQPLVCKFLQIKSFLVWWLQRQTCCWGHGVGWVSGDSLETSEANMLLGGRGGEMAGVVFRKHMLYIYKL